MKLLTIILTISAFTVGYITSEVRMTAQAGYDRQFEVIEAEITGFSPSPHITDSTPFEMASGRVAKPTELEQLKFVALSRDLIKQYNIKYGDLVWISFNFQDKMGPKAKQGVDIFFRSIDLARKWGRQNRTIIIERRN